jgi:hypothetical protein
MPYYIYRVSTGPVQILEKLTQFDAFKDASGEAKRMRKEVDLTKMKIKVVFGDNEIQAEEALMSVREAEPLTGDDW